MTEGKMHRKSIYAIAYLCPRSLRGLIPYGETRTNPCSQGASGIILGARPGLAFISPCFYCGAVDEFLAQYYIIVL